jgi:hypothetical protein
MNELLPIIGKNYRDACMAEITKAGMGEDMVNRIEMDLHKAMKSLTGIFYHPL